MEYHNPVLLKETVDGLNIKPGGVYVDVTFGGGGHSAEILRRLGPDGKLFAFDQDEDALANALPDERFTLINENLFINDYFDCKLPGTSGGIDLQISTLLASKIRNSTLLLNFLPESSSVLVAIGSASLEAEVLIRAASMPIETKTSLAAFALFSDNWSLYSLLPLASV